MKSSSTRPEHIGKGAVRRAQGAEVAHLVELINEAYLVEQHFVTGPRTTEASVRAMVDRQEFIVLEAVVDSATTLVAAARVHCCDEAGHLGLLSVRPDQQGRGIGRRMIAVAESLAMAAGARRMELQVVNLRDELTAFYRGLGYRPVGTSVFDETESTLKPVHFIDMVKDLPS